MEQITVKDLIEATGGRLLCGKPEIPVEHITTDSRKVQGHELFVPLIGERVDAHCFIEQTLELGAAAVLTSEHDQMESEQAWIRVADTKRALQDIGVYCRKRLSIPLVGVTGSVGKTTTREMIAAALSAGYRVYKTPGNSNSQVGVPISISEISRMDEIGVLELGMSEPGELTVIARIANVDMAVITNIGVAHIEQLGSKENIYQEKLTIQDGLKKGGILFLNGDDEFLKHTVARPGYSTVYYGTGENCQYRAVDIRMEDGYPSFTAVHGNLRIPMKLSIMGAHQVENAMVAMAVAHKNGVPMEAAARCVEQFTGFENRQQVYKEGGITIIDDTYNASPDSMKAAINILATMNPSGRRIAVLADMKELGRDTRKFHYEIGFYLREKPMDLVVTLGELGKEIGRGITEGEGTIQVHGFLEKEALNAWLDAEIKPGDCVLFKGSNSMRLGEVVEHVRQHHH